MKTSNAACAFFFFLLSFLADCFWPETQWYRGAQRLDETRRFPCDSSHVLSSLTSPISERRRRFSLSTSYYPSRISIRRSLLISRFVYEAVVSAVFFFFYVLPVFIWDVRRGEFCAKCEKKNKKRPKENTFIPFRALPAMSEASSSACYTGIKLAIFEAVLQTSAALGIRGLLTSVHCSKQTLTSSSIIEAECCRGY